MALTVKQLNGDASFLLHFEPIEGPSAGPWPAPEPFRILLDPCLEDSYDFNPKASFATHVQVASVSSLQQLPQPDLVIVTNARSEHCNETTLRQLAPSGTKTTILAEPAAAKVIRSWKYFDESTVKTLDRWETRTKDRDTVVRVPVPPQVCGGNEGEVTVSLIHQKRDLTGLHSAVAITYRPPPPHASIFRRQATTPPKSPTSSVSELPPQIPTPRLSLLQTPDSPVSAILGAFTPPASPDFMKLRTVRSLASIPPQARNRAVSLIYSPYGTSYSCMEPYVTSHLLAEAALPLTAILHPFDTVPHPWGLSGNLGAGVTAGLETARSSGVRVWISARDGKNVGGLAAKLMYRKKYPREEAEEVIRQAIGQSNSTGSIRYARGKRPGRSTETLALSQGEEVTMTSEGIWEETECPSPLQYADEKLNALLRT
ncbi:beta-lactamase superfamily domain-containing protein [Purpureocillium lavendulum]|uniref:Beta-lactamase superfamily domain-containing protein n=1 Tax=Purpureocillium lavendulum TaxID=1247861 RepID=A0AB34G3Q4_9HYPO|nr:beta-lactamase superfamily domain-containing protein [Purpureocillium lavendulum]